MRVSILGCGWLGLPLAASLVEDGHEVRGSTTKPDKLEAIRDAGAQPHLVRLSPEPVGETEGFFDADLLIVTLPPAGDDEAYLQRLASVVAAGRKEGTRRYLFTSSTSVYAERGEIVDETDTTPPATERGKRMREAEALFLTPPIDAVILRLGGLMGPDREPGRFLAGRTGVNGPGQPVNLVHRDDVIAVIRELIRQGVHRGVFNVVADEHPPKRAYYTARAEALGLEPPTFSEEPSPGKRVSNQKVKDVLGYTFEHGPTI